MLGSLASRPLSQSAFTTSNLSRNSSSLSRNSTAFSNSWFSIQTFLSRTTISISRWFFFISGDWVISRRRTLDPASSITSIALSGRNRSLMYRSANRTAVTIDSSEILTLWCSSYGTLSPLIISMVSSTVGGFTMMGWKRLSSAPFFSMYFRYSSRVVAPMHWISPRDKAGLSILDASTEPSAAPAPTKVCSSSINKMTLSFWMISFMMPLRRASNWPRYLVPAIREPRSSETTRLSKSVSGTSRSIISWARPSTIAVLPTPGSPINTGLFFVRRLRIWITRSISLARPMIGSSFPSSAILVKSRLNSSRVGVLPTSRLLSVGSLNISTIFSRTSSKNMPKLFRTRQATPSFSFKRPRRRCSVPI